MAGIYDNKLKSMYMPKESSLQMGEEPLMRQATVPQVDFTKETLAEQMPEKNDASQVLGAGDAVTTASAFGPPPVQAIGLGLKAIGMIEKARLAKYQMELQRLKDRQDAIYKMAEIGRGLKV
jgi:hypothetical protein